MRDLHSSVNESHLIDSLDLGREAGVDTENFSLDHSSDAEVIKHFSAVLPWVGVSVLSNGLVVEAVNSCDLSSLVVASQESDVSWVLHFQAQEQLECFN